jgi:hypothetical protein
MIITNEDLVIVKETAHKRRSESIKKHLRNDLFGSKKSYDFLGALGELALSKYLGIPYVPTVNTYKQPDVAGYQVRTTTRPDGCLIIRKKDRVEDVYVLVVAKECSEGYDCDIIGWCRGDLREDRFLRNPGDFVDGESWFIPQLYLNKMETLEN